MSKHDQFQKKVAMYLRVSSEDQVEKYGLDLQEDAIRGLVASKGTLDDGSPACVIAENHIYKDEGISGTTEIEDRPGFARLYEDIINSDSEQLPFDVVAVYKIDRFARRLKILLNVIDFFEDNQVKFISANESIDTSTPFGKAILSIVGVIAELEIETTKARTQAGRKQARKRGVFMGATPPYGYIKNADKQLIVFDKEKENVELIFRLLNIDKLTPQQIADRLKEMKILTPDAAAVHHNKRKGKVRRKNSLYFWRAEKVRSILKDEVYRGKYYYAKYKDNRKQPKGKWKLSPYRHEPIIPAEIFNLAQKNLNDLSSRKSLKTKKRRKSKIYLLSGLLKCGYCEKEVGEAFTFAGEKKRKKDTYYYKCGRRNTKKYSETCDVLPLPGEQIEDYVVKIVKNVMRSPRLAYDYQKDLQSTQLQRKHLKNKQKHYLKLINAIPGRIERLRDEHKSGLINLNQLKDEREEELARKDRLEKRLDELQYQLSENALTSGYIESFKEYKKAYQDALTNGFQDQEELYKIIHHMIEEIKIESRPKREDDVIAGRKKPNQQVPFAMHIKFRLPYDMMLALYDEEHVKNLESFCDQFSVTTSNL